MTIPELLRRFALGSAMLAASMIAAGAQGLPARFDNPSRIATIGGSLTEIVYALGEEDLLVARDSTSVYPDAALDLPDVGYMRALSAEGVLSVAPSGILALDGSGPRETIDVLDKANVQMILVPESFDRAGILAKIHIVGAALNVDSKAEALASRVEADLATAEKLTAGIAVRKRVLFILSTQSGKLLAAGSGTAADGIIAMAGGVNAVDGFAGYKHLSDEAAILARPDIILMMDRGGNHSIAGAELFALPAIASTPAGQSKSLVQMDAAYLLGFGPRTASAIRDLAASLYGDQIKD